MFPPLQRIQRWLGASPTYLASELTEVGMLAREVPWVGVVAGRIPVELESYLSPNNVGPALFGLGQVW